MPLISILLPVYNAEVWLEECLNSILHQTIADWELLAIDDQSDDGSPMILSGFAKEDNRITVLKTQKKGIIPALHLAFENSNGQFITRMDADDVMAPHKLETLHQLISEKGEGHIATGLVKYISSVTLGDGYLRYEKWLNGLCENNTHYQDIYRECVLPSPCWMTYREDLIRCGAFEPNRYPEDYDLCFRFYEKNLKVVSTKSVLHYWRDHPERTSRNSETYANQEYFDLKLPWFLKLDYDSLRPLVLWGTGKKGKALARKLSDAQVSFRWITNNVRKQSINIYGVWTEAHLVIEQLKNPQVIVAVSGPGDQKNIQFYCKKIKKDMALYFFC